MFTGIIEEVGEVCKLIKGTKSAKITIKANKIFDDIKLGDSISTNGVCLTVSQFDINTFSADIMNETLNCTSLLSLRNGSVVNLERAMLANGRFGGHIVTGHVDGIGVIKTIKFEDIAILYTIKTQESIIKYIVEKGSITIDGISLTVVKVEKDSFSVSVIPHTQKQTNLHKKIVGDKVNLENDIVGKYIEKFTSNKTITNEFLKNSGF